MECRYTENIEQAVVEITNRCNLRCPHCASASGRARSNEMTLAEIRVLMRDLAKLGCRTVTLLGGEFLLRPDWRHVAEAVKDGEMSLNLTPESYRAVCGVDGVGYGTATLKRPSMSWPITVK